VQLELSLEEGQALTDVDLVFSGGLAIEGLVVDAEARPLAGATACLWKRERPTEALYTPFLQLDTREDGRFRFDGLEPDTFRLSIDAGGSRAATAEAGGFEVGLAEVAAGTSGLRIEFPRLAPITGSVRDAAGQPVAGASVCLPNFDGEVLPRARTDAAGRFQVWAAEDVLTTLTVIRPQDRSKPREQWPRAEGVRAGAEDVVITLPQ
jgi:hypothetical protein